MIKILSGRFSELNWAVILVALLGVANYAFN